jgi:hypothetical protein
MARDPLGPIEVVRTHENNIDPAIDRKASNLAEYRRTRDLVHLVMKEGMKPAVFVVQPMARRFVTIQIDAIRGNPAFAAEQCFLSTCHEIRMPDGNVMRPTQVLRDAPYGMRMASNEWLEECQDEFGNDVIQEIGAMAYERAKLPKGASGPFAWPPI